MQLCHQRDNVGRWTTICRLAPSRRFVSSTKRYMPYSLLSVVSLMFPPTPPAKYPKAQGLGGFLTQASRQGRAERTKEGRKEKWSDVPTHFIAITSCASLHTLHTAAAVIVSLIFLSWFCLISVCPPHVQHHWSLSCDQGLESLFYVCTWHKVCSVGFTLGTNCNYCFSQKGGSRW